MSMGGGAADPGSPGMVVGGPSSWAAMEAGRVQANAAKEAAEMAQRSATNAISAMNKMYQQARYDVQPYRTQGVQALNQLNQYLQLDPYNPGASPTEPTKKTANDMLDEVSRNQLSQYIKSNVGFITSGRGFVHPQYTGYGSDDPELKAKYMAGWEAIAPYPGALTQTGSYAKTNAKGGWHGGGGADPEVYVNDARIRELAKFGLAEDLAFEENRDLDDRIEAYKRDLEEWTQNKAWYDKYKAEGPYTQQQISDKITNLPGYQAQLEQGVDAIQKGASARGYLGSGRLLKELNQYGQNTLSTFYGNELSRLASLAGMGQQAASQTAQNSTGLGQGLAGIHMNLGDTKANSALASGNALAQALLAANQEYKVIGARKPSGGGGGLGGLGSVLGGIGSILGSGMFSSKSLKEKTGTPSTKEILENVRTLDIDTWHYHGIPKTHIGPYAEDFRDRFGVGDGRTINMIDIVGVMFASVKELANVVAELKQEVKTIKRAA